MSETMVRLQLNIFLCTVAAYRNKGGMLFYHLQLSMVAGEGGTVFPHLHSGCRGGTSNRRLHNTLFLCTLLHI